MGGLVLFTLVTLVTFSSSYSETKFPGLMDLSDRLLIDGFGLCGVICVAPNLHEHVNKTLYQCQNTLMTIQHEQQQQRQRQRNFEDFYNFAFKRQGSADSKMCSWTHSVVDGCFGKLVTDHCDHSGIKREMTRMMQGAKAYICSQDPPVMECAMHPEVTKDVPYCLDPLESQFRKYFNGTVRSMEEEQKQFQRLYNGEILANNGESMYTAFKTLGTCVSTIIGKSSVRGTSCSKVQELLDTEIDNIITYFNKTDMLKCSLNPALWRQLEVCGHTFVKAVRDRAVTPDPSSYKFPYDPMPHTVEQFRRFAADDYQLLEEPLKAFMTCTLQAIDTVCGKKWTYNVVQTQITLLQSIFNPKDNTVPQHCEALVKEQQTSSASTSKVVVANVAAAVLLRVFMMS